MCRFEVGEEFLGVLALPRLGFRQPLTDTLPCVGPGGDIEQPLVGLGILRDCRGFSLYTKDHGAFRFLRCFMI